MNLSGKSILVIGANGVFGRLLAEKLSARGAQVMGTARDQEGAARLPNGLSQGLILDLESAPSIRALTDWLIAASVPLDGVVVASGRVAFGTIDSTEPATAERLMQINHFGPAQVITNLLPTLTTQREDGDAKFVMSITGVVAEKVYPGMSAYTASKTAHSTWLRTLELETRRAKLRVLDARPGHTETGLATRPLAGTAPNFGIGMTPDWVTDVMIRAIESDSNDLSSDAFAGGPA